MLSLRNCRVGVVGLGYVGVPLAVEFGKQFDTVGFDVKPERIKQLRAGKDLYYLTHKAQEVGYHREMILAGRRLNDNMGLYVAGEIIKLMTGKRIQVKGSRVLVLGLTFKENCPDVRNSKVVDVIRELQKYGIKVDVYDPWIDRKEALHEYGIKPIASPRAGSYDAVVLAVAHREFKEMGVRGLRKLGKRNHVLYDIKYVLPAAQVDGRL